MSRPNKITKLFDHKMWLYDFAKVTGALPVLFDQRMKRLYLDGKKPKDLFKGKFIIAANHGSFEDPVSIMHAVWSRRVLFLATKEIFKRKFNNWLFKHTGAIKLDRDDVSIDTFKQVKDVLDRGHIVTIFPEAHVDKQEEIRSFKSGIGMISVLCEAPILPIYIAPRHKRRNRQIVVIGNKIDYKQYMDSSASMRESMDKITQLLQQEEIKLKQLYDSWKNRKENNNG